MTVRPWRTVFRGNVEVRGLWLKEPAAEDLRRRVLSLWQPGTRVHAAADGWIMVFPSSRRLHVGDCSGSPLIAHGERFTSSPLSAGELEALSDGGPGLVLTSGGRARHFVWSELESIDPADWLTLPQCQVATVEALSDPPVIEHSGVPEARRLLDALEGKIEAPPPERDETVAEITHALRGQTAAEQKAAPRAGWLARLGAWLSGIGRQSQSAAPSHSGLLARLWTALLHGPSLGGSDRIARMAQSKPTWIERLGRWFARTTMTSTLGRLLGHRQAEYVRRMLRMFDDQDLANALRHAIPLAGPGSDSSRPALGVPHPRTSLTVGRAASGGATLSFGDELYLELQRRYRQTFEQLKRAGRIEEAAFVLAELLGQALEAVSFLERNGRLRMAAEVAEAREVAAGVIVRQWLLAGDKERAVHLARHLRAFDEAVRMLERDHADLANELREIWAHKCAGAGDFERAVAIAWAGPPGLAAIADEWLDLAITGGGVAGARMLARKLRRLNQANTSPELKALVERCARLLSDTTLRGLNERRALCEELSKADHGAVHQRLCGRAVRSLMRDRALHGMTANDRLLNRLLARANDAPLRADMPRLSRAPTRTPLAKRAAIEPATIENTDVGSGAVWDAVPLPNGKLLVCDGEAGVRLLRVDGSSAGRLATPANTLVLADSANKGLALARRGRLFRLSHIDPVRRQWRDWGDVELDAWSPTTDGDRWWVGWQDCVAWLDLFRGTPATTWRVGELGGAVCAAAADSDMASAVTTSEDGLEVWVYRIAGMRLLSRHQVGGLDMAIGAVAISPAGSVLLTDGEHALMLAPDRSEKRGLVQLGGAMTRSTAASLAGQWAVVTIDLDESIGVYLMDADELRVRYALVLEGARRATARIAAGLLCVSDDRGRVITMDLETGALVHDLRL